MELFTSTLPQLFFRPVIVTVFSAMLNRFKNAFYSVVNNLDTLSPDKAIETGNSTEPKLPLKFPYTRPHFLQLNGEDEIQVAGDHVIRPIIVPRDITKIPWNSGYAEAVNAGKSIRNEDQARIYISYLERFQSLEHGPVQETSEFHTPLSTPEKGPLLQPRHRIPYYYFAMFDGHAGTGAAISAANELHCILQEKLMDVIDHILPPLDSIPSTPGQNQVFWFPEKEISVESFLVGALEATFHEMDKLIAEDRFKYRVTGGCTALVALFICGKLLVANAGDSRAVLCRGRKAFPLSNDFTPETERQRVRKLAALQPELLGGEYTALDFSRRPNRRDIGQRILYREPHMTGWAYKIITPDDLKFPVVYGEGKRSRVLATIGVTRGFGDHDLRAPNSNILIKPFLSSQPEVRIVDLEKETIYPTDVLVMGTDGLWDVTSNERAAEVVHQSLEQFPPSDNARYRYRFTSAAQDLVMSSRGKLVERNWKTFDNRAATIDDISVFVIPLLPYKEECMQWKQEQELLRYKLDNEVSTAYTSFTDKLQIKKTPSREKNGESEVVLPTLNEIGVDGVAEPSIAESKDTTAEIHSTTMGTQDKLTESQTEVGGELSDENSSKLDPVMDNPAVIRGESSQFTNDTATNPILSNGQNLNIVDEASDISKTVVSVVDENVRVDSSEDLNPSSNVPQA